MKAHEGGYYIRLNAKDVPGALAAIASRMGGRLDLARKCHPAAGSSCYRRRAER